MFKINWTPELKEKAISFIDKEFTKDEIFSVEHVMQDDFLSGQGAMEFLANLADLLEPNIEKN